MDFLSKRCNDNRLSLQTLCLHVIVKNFQQFHFAYAASKDARLQRNMEFLQRKFSNYLAVKLIHNKDVYFDFVINKHLTSVNFFWYGSVCHLMSLEDFFFRLPNLTKIRFACSSGDKILECIAKFCPRIVEIDAGWSKITDKGIKYLCETRNGLPPCPELKIILNVRGRLITAKGVELLLRSVPSIEQLDYPNLPLLLHSIYTENLSPHQKGFFCNLTELNFRACDEVQDFTEVLKTCLTVCPKLKELLCKISEREQYDVLVNSLLCLKILFLQFPKRSSNFNIDNYFKANGRNLTLLSICYCTVSISVLAKHCPALQELEVTGVDFIDDDKDPQPIFPSLTKFNLDTRYGGVPLKTVCLLPVLSPNVECVKLTCPILSSEMKNHILTWCKNPAAKSIRFLGSKLEINFFKDCLLSSPSLSLMILVSCKFDVCYPHEILKAFAENLPNKPEIIVSQGCQV